ncbi:MAG: hypothetical protein GYA62_05470 [Bacteroidales bacterium]|nr:hypothetical protein [Bacteroidales bacterium]
MKKILLILGVVSLIQISCKKDNKENDNNTSTPLSDEIVAASDDAVSSNMFDDVFKQASFGGKKMDDSLSGKFNKTTFAGGCAIVTITPFDLTSWPKTVTVDFGTTNCLGNDGRYRRGKVIMNITSWYRDSGCVITVTPQNYYVNDYKIEGTKVITNLGRNSSNHLLYSVVVTNGKVTDPNGSTYRTWNSTREHEWINGENTVLNPWDDEYLVTGTANGITRTGKNYTIVITTPLNVCTCCRWIRSGQLTLTVDTHNPIYIDYGPTSSCDDEASVTVNGVNYVVHMN